MLDSSLAELLYRARRMATLTASGKARADLEGLIASGLLRTSDQIIDQCRKQAKSVRPLSTRSLLFFTKDRTPQLARCISSYARELIRRGRNCNMIVLDDSGSAGRRKNTRKALRLLSRELGIGISYAGREEKQHFIKELSKESKIPEPLVHFALIGSARPGTTTLGANRNCMLLGEAGDVVFNVDDDTECEFAGENGGGGLRVSCEPDPNEYWFFRSREDLLKSVHRIDCDLLTSHESLIGQTVVQLIAQAASPVLDVDADLVEHILTDRARVVLTFPGLFGDAAMSYAWGLLSLGGASRKRLLADGRSYRAALRSRMLLRAPVSTTISGFASCMTYAFGLDIRTCLPPFFPLYRGQDALFGLAVETVVPGAMHATLPVAVAHFPEGRTGFLDPVPFLCHLDPIRLIGACINDFESSPYDLLRNRTVAERLEALGQHLQRISSLREGSFAELTRWLLWTWKSEDAASAGQILEKYAGAPRFWRQDVAQIKRSLESSLNDEIDPRINRRCARLLNSFGRLLEAWPVLFDAALRLRARGISLSRPA